jgi:hypothetical protein
MPEMSMSMSERVAVLRIENERLLLENWQLKGALGYPVPADIPEGAFRCGMCSAKNSKPARPALDEQVAQ